MSFVIRQLIVLSLAFAFPAMTLAQSVLNNQAELEDLQGETQPSRFTMLTTGGVLANSLSGGELGARQDMSLTIEPRYQLSESIDIFALIPGQLDVNGPRGLQTFNSRVFMRAPIKRLSQSWLTDIRLGSWLPTATNELDQTSFVVGFDVEPRLTFFGSTFGKSLMAFYQPRLRRDFFRFEGSQRGQPNAEWRFRHRVVTVSGLTPKLGLILLAQVEPLSLPNGRQRSNFLFYQALSYALNPNTQIVFSHNNGGNVVAVDGQSSNVALFDENTSTFGIQISYFMDKFL